MHRHIRLGELLIGVEGVALMRGLFTASDESAQQRVDEVKRLLASTDAELDAFIVAPEFDVAEGYARWSTTYDAPGNPLVSAEQQTTWEIIDALPAGRALDAACGTGRHALRLVQRGHEVTGIDATPEMLARAQAKVPAAHFQTGDITALPLPDDSFDLAVCALALDHVPDLGRPIAELARVVRAGGHLVISDLHPVVKAVGAAAFFRDGDGAAGIVRVHSHSHADYLDAFAACGLTVVRCIEPRFSPAEVRMQHPAWDLIPEATMAAYVDLPIALIWHLTVGP